VSSSATEESLRGQQCCEVDLAACPLIQALRVAAEEAQKREAEGRFKHLLQACVAATEGCSVAQLIGLYSSKLSCCLIRVAPDCVVRYYRYFTR
jgi:hypothetical protein